MIAQDSELEFCDTLFLRAPFYSFETYGLGRMPEILSLSSFKNALWLASPALHAATEKKGFNWHKLEKNEQLSLYKYYNRMSFRPTPFGAFASFCLVGWDDRDRIKLCAGKDSVLHLLPSRQWLELEQMDLLQTNKDYLLRSNPTLNRVGAYYRLVKSISSPAGKLKFLVNEIKAEKLTVYLAGLCRNAPVRKSELLENITTATNCSADEAGQFLDFLVNEQVLFTGYGGRLITSGYWELNPPLPATANSFAIGHQPDLPALMANLPGSDLPKGRFYAGLERNAESGGVAKTVAGDLLAAIKLLRKLVIPYPTPALKDFKDAFKQKFDGQRVPLLQALDPDTGISYGTLFAAPEADGLLEDLNFQRSVPANPPLDWTAVHQLFLKTWVRNPYRSFYGPVVITDADAASLEPFPNNAKFPPSLPVMFTRCQDKILLDNLGGATALSLLGRFSVFSPEIAACCKNIATEEEAANPGVIFTEVHQLSDTHVDNVNRRVPLYSHVTDINTFPMSCPGQAELPLGDLMVSLHGEELWLESMSLGKRVIPRLPTAYNFHHNGLALFQILCDLQFEGLQANLTFDLEKLFPGLDFYPRVEYRNIVISPARWKLSAADVAGLMAKPVCLGKLHQLRQERGIPAQLTMGLSDRQLNFNLVNDDEALFFLECLKESKAVTLREYLTPGYQLTAEGKAHNGQYIAVLKNLAAVYHPLPGKSTVPAATVQRQFLPGSEWLYLKIYCTPESANRLLTRFVAPFIKTNSRAICQWFLIRYLDPAPHIRLRLKSSTGESGALLTKLTTKLAQQQRTGLVRDVKCEIYEREIERYSPEMITAVEEYFCAGSDWVMARLKNGYGDDGLDAFLSVYQLAVEFLKKPEEAALFFKWRSASFLEEFGADKKLKISFDSKYRKLTGPLKQMLEARHVADKDNGKLLRSLAAIATDTASWPADRRYMLLADLIHMQVNRIYSSRQRQHEALICYCLAKYALSAAKTGALVRDAGC